VPRGQQLFPKLLMTSASVLLVLIVFVLAFQQMNIALLLASAVLLIGTVLAFQQMQCKQNSIERRAKAWKTVSTFSQSLTAQLPPEKIIAKVSDFVENQIDYTLFYVGLLESDEEIATYPLVRFNKQTLEWQSCPCDEDLLLKRGLDAEKITVFNWEASFSERITLSTTSLVCSVPLVTMDKRVGGMVIIYEGETLQPEQIATLEIVANEAALAIRNATLYARQSRLIENLTSVNQAVQDVMFSLDEDTTVRSAAETVKRITSADGLALFILNSDDDNHANTLRLAYSSDLTDDHKRLYNDPLYRPQLLAEKYIFIPDLLALPDSDPRQKLGQVGQFKAMLHFSLKSGSTTVGAMCIFHKSFPQYHETQLELLETFTYQITAAMDYIELLGALEVYASEQAQLVHLSRVTVANLELESVIESAASIIHQMIDVDDVSVALLDGDTLILYETPDTPKPILDLSAFVEFGKILKSSQPIAYVFHQELAQEPLQSFAAARQWTLLAVIPMIANNEAQGLILLGFKQFREITSDQRRLLEMATNQISAQIFNAQQHTQTQAALNRRLEQMALIENIALQISQSHDVDQLIHHVLEAAIRATQAGAASLGLIADEYHMRMIHRELIDDVWHKTESLQWIEQGIVAYAMSIERTLIIEENQTHFAYIAMPTYEQVYQSSLTVPISTDRQIIGALSIESVEKAHFNQEHVQFVHNLVGHAAISIQNTQLLRQRENRIEALTRLREFSVRLSSDINRDRVISIALEVTLELFPAQWVAFYVVNAANPPQQQASRQRDSKDDVQIENILPPRILQDVMDTTQIQQSNLIPRSIGQNQAYTSLVAAPLKDDSVVKAILVLGFGEQQRFDRDNREVLELFLIQLGGQLENADLYEQVRAKQDQTQAILDSARDGIILLDTNGILLEANFSAEGILNLPLDRFVGRNFVNMLFDELEAQATSSQLQDILAGIARTLRLEPHRITNRTFEIKRGDRTQHIEESGTPVYDSEGQIVGRLLTLRDITEERLLEQFREEITSMVIHDLRGPLTSIITSIELAAETLDDLDNEEARGIVPVLRVSNEGAGFLLQLVESLLDITRLETRRLPMERSVVSIETVIRDAVLTMQSSLETVAVEVIEDIEPGLPDVYIDTDKMRRVIINLLDNAMRFSPHGGYVLVEANRFNEQKLLVRIADSGPGIPDDEAPHVFDKFHQIAKQQPVEARQGTGLGLTFCKLVVEAHDESIWVDQESPLPGACFAFTVPIAFDMTPPIISPKTTVEER